MGFTADGSLLSVWVVQEVPSHKLWKHMGAENEASSTHTFVLQTYLNTENHTKTFETRKKKEEENTFHTSPLLCVCETLLLLMYSQLCICQT